MEDKVYKDSEVCYMGKILGFSDLDYEVYLYKVKYKLLYFVFYYWERGIVFE